MGRRIPRSKLALKQEFKSEIDSRSSTYHRGHNIRTNEVPRRL
jgi:hypothetical protein